MAKSPKQKMKLLFLIKMLQENTDEHHVLTTQEIIDKLAANDIHAERKSIYDDIRTLQDFGYDILQAGSRSGGGYWLGSREFELPELKLLVDAVQSSRFITTKKSRELIHKLEHMVSRHDAGKLQRQVYVAGRIKTENESIYYSIDAIHRAIQENRQISFPYLEWTLKKELSPREGKERYLVSPWALIWREENYYLVAYDEEAKGRRIYRVDKMADIKIETEPRSHGEEFTENAALLSKKTFGMYDGKVEMVRMKFFHRMMNTVIDKFGADVVVYRVDDEHFEITVPVAISPQFCGWIFGLGRQVEILEPKSVVKKMKDMLKNVGEMYQ